MQDDNVHGTVIFITKFIDKNVKSPSRRIWLKDLLRGIISSETNLRSSTLIELFEFAVTQEVTMRVTDPEFYKKSGEDL